MPSERGPSVRSYFNLPRKAKLPFTDAVLVDETLYLSGRIGIDPATAVAPASVDEELRLLFDAGRLPVDRFNTAYLKRFSKELPARAFIGSGPLLKGGRFEMMGIAVRR